MSCRSDGRADRAAGRAEERLARLVITRETVMDAVAGASLVPAADQPGRAVRAGSGRSLVIGG